MLGRDGKRDPKRLLRILLRAFNYTPPKDSPEYEPYLFIRNTATRVQMYLDDPKYKKHPRGNTNYWKGGK